MFSQPVTLTGNIVRLRPLVAGDAKALGCAAADGDLSKLRYTRVPSHETAADAIAQALAGEAEGTQKVFATTLVATGQLIGSTRFWYWNAGNRTVEIGHTFIARSHQRTAVNTEAKYLMLRYGFEQLDCLRIELRTDLRNAQSQAAIERIGAKKEGVLRNERIMADGYVRDTVVYSIIASEWPDVRPMLEGKLKAAGLTPAFRIE